MSEMKKKRELTGSWPREMELIELPSFLLLPAAVMGCTAAMGSAKERQAKGEKEMEGIDLLLFLYGRNEIKSYLIEWNPIKNGRR